jgi:hypothetical protein
MFIYLVYCSYGECYEISGSYGAKYVNVSLLRYSAV